MPLVALIIIHSEYFPHEHHYIIYDKLHPHNLNLRSRFLMEDF